MSTEERWANQKEWANERGEIELKYKHPENIADDHEVCRVRGCRAEAVFRYKIGRVVETDFSPIDLCLDHNSEDVAFDIYNREEFV